MSGKLINDLDLHRDGEAPISNDVLEIQTSTGTSTSKITANTLVGRYVLPGNMFTPGDSDVNITNLGTNTVVGFDKQRFINIAVAVSKSPSYEGPMLVLHSTLQPNVDRIFTGIRTSATGLTPTPFYFWVRTNGNVELTNAFDSSLSHYYMNFSYRVS